MAWSVWSVDTVTGVKQNPLPVSAFPWARVLNAGASGEATVPLRSEAVQEIGKAGIKELTIPRRRTLVLDWDGTVVYAGLIQRRKYNRTSGMLEIDHTDIWSILSRRLAIDHTVPESKRVHQVFTNLSSGTVAKRLVTSVLVGPPDMNMGLPVSFPADESGPISRTYYGYHFPWLGDVLRDLMGEDGGTDIDFRPRWVNNKLDWQMRTGTVAAPKLTEGAFEWNLGAGQSGVLGLSVTEDASKVASASYAIGEGSEEDMLTRSVGALNPVTPYADRITLLPTEDNVDALMRYAVGDLTAFMQPTEQWEGFSILASGTPKVSDLLLGARATVWAQDDPWLDGGRHDNRIIGFSGDLSETVKLQFQPEVN